MWIIMHLALYNFKNFKQIAEHLKPIKILPMSQCETQKKK